ncbi:MAG: cell division protein ZapE [Robiginitomaculum sp.]|nr:MAG: cell division protein ZapE [Robiginitomaculum sp.]
MGTPIEIWRKRVADGQLHHDPAQERAAQMLTLLSGRLLGWKPGKKTLLFGRPEPQPIGLYLYADVGRGKSMLMDMFFQSAPVNKKIRVHFHDFMQNCHREIAKWRGLSERERQQHANFVRGAGNDPIAPLAKGIFDQANLICFDEFQVSDIADAMLLGRLFEQLFERGIVMVATSNRPPEDLYKDGLNRRRFLPFIELLGQKLDALELPAARDYRREQLATSQLYFTPLGAGANGGLDRLWGQLLAGAQEMPRSLHVLGRELVIARTFGGSARTDFAALCAVPLAAADYLELASQFHTLFLEQVPKLGPEQRNEAKRFVMLIDTLYEAGVKLVISADAEPDQLYDQGDGSFEFSRCASRLIEMRSDSWAEMVHAGRGLAV